ncbi:transcription factor A, mitochondrial [Entelurus aequoreus]|uniref:transcription factor A, mitochondrial n=1 Tax=Entelurus aequoreus TaxID=161455 RepID=UPI002B1D150E|nr:transcription factor A, mitochondrial [Entelurus aequoreus]
MAPFSFMTASVSLLAKSFNVFSCTSTSLARVVQAAYSNPVKCLCTQAYGPPKRPLNGYMRYSVQQKPHMARQNPDLKLTTIISKIAQEWKTMSQEQKQPFEDAFLREKEQFNIDLKNYRAQLTPEEIQQEVIEKRERLAKRKAIRKKRMLTRMGMPKRPRSQFNIFMSEHYKEARGTTTQAKMKSLLEDWRNLSNNQKQIFVELAMDDKIRYNKEMASWEDHMLEIRREDLIRNKTLSAKKKASETAQTKTVKKVAEKSPTARAATTRSTEKTKAKSKASKPQSKT